MENQEHQKLAHSSSDHHGVHVCHKCGWPYPNPHPSAKHRRAHKRICGKVEGYKLFDSEGSTHSNASDDEHLSDEDHQTPGPKVLGASSEEKGSHGSPELLSRLEDEVSSDAATKSLDHGAGGRAQGRVEAAAESATKVEKILKTESNKMQSVDGSSLAETVEPLGSSSYENILTQHSETPETTSDRSVCAPELTGSSAGFKSNPILSSVSDHRAEGLAVLLDGSGNASADVFRPIHSETLEDVSYDKEKTNTADDFVDNSLKPAEQQTNLEGQKETYLDSNLQDVKISPGKLEDETAGAISKSDETPKVKLESSPPKPEHDTFQLQKEFSDGFHLKTSKRSPDVESGEHANAPSDTVRKTVDIAGGINYVKSCDLVEKKGEVAENVHVLSVSDDVHKFDNPETMLEDFKDHKAMKLDQPASLEYELATDKGGDTKSLVLEESTRSIHGEGSLVSSSDKHVLEDSVQLDQRGSVRIIKDVLVEGDINISKLQDETTGKQRSNEAGAAGDVGTPYVDKAFSVFSLDGQGSHDAWSDTLEGNFLQSSDNTMPNADLVIASPNVGSGPETHLVSESGHKKAGKSDLSADYKSKEAKEVYFAENPVAAAESARSGSEIRANPAVNLQEQDDAGNYVKIGSKKNEVTRNDDAVSATHSMTDEDRVDNKSSPAKASFSEQPVVAPGSTKDRSEFEINRGANLWEVDISGSFEKVGTKIDEIKEDSCDAVARPFSEQPVVAPESAESHSEVEISSEINLRGGETAGSFEKVGTKNDKIMGDSCGAAAHHVKDKTGVDNNNSPPKESSSEHPIVISGWAKNLADYVVTPVVMWAKGETGVDTGNSPSKEIFSEHPVVTPGSAETVYDIKNNPETNLWEGDTAVNFVKLETKKDKKTGEAYAGAAHHMKDEAGVDSSDSRSVESYSKHTVVTPESAENLSEVEISLEANIQVGGTVGSVEKAETKKDNIAADAFDSATHHAKDEAGVNNNYSPSAESCPEHLLVTPDSARSLSEVEISPENKLWEGDTVGNLNKVETEKDEITQDADSAAAPHAKEAGVDAGNSPSKNSFLEHPVFTPESAKNVHDITINPQTNLREGDSAGNFEKPEAKKDKKTGDTFDGAACHVKDEAAVDIGSIPAESGSEHALITPESAKNLSEVEIKPQSIIQGGDTVGSFEKVETKNYEITGDACGDAARDMKDATGVDNKTSPSKEIFLVQTVVAPQSALSEVEVNRATDLREGETAGNFDKVETKKDDITGDAYDVAGRHVKDEISFGNDKSQSEDNSSSEQPVVTPESAKNLSEVQINPESNIGEGDTADNFEKTEAKKVDVAGDARDFDACYVKGKTGVDNNITPSKEVFSEQPLINPESAKTLAEIEINSKTNPGEGDAAGNFDKVETKKEDIAVDACDVIASHVKDELGVDNSLVPTKERSEHPRVLVSAGDLSDLEVNLKNNLQEEDTAHKFEKVETKKERKTGDSSAGAADNVEREIGISSSVGPPKESGLENAAVTPESANQSSQLNVNPATNSQEDNDAFDPKKGKTEKLVERGTESKESSVKENQPTQLKTTPESASHPQDIQTVAEDVVIRSTDSAFDSSRCRLVDDVVREIHIEAMDHQLAENDKVQVGKGPTLSSLDTKSSIQSSTKVEGNSARELDAASGLDSGSFQRESDGQQFGDPTNGMSVDSSSRTDSLENNWGSVSVVSLQSDAQAATDADSVIPIESQVVIGEKANLKESKTASERQYPDKSDMFEPPSFVTLVEPGVENDQKGSGSEIPTGQSSQQAKSPNSQAGWLPSITHVVNESPGRKKNEEIIAKVTNWSTSKPHIPLKNLLGEASLDPRAKSPKRKDLAPSPQKDDKEPSTVTSIGASESPLDQAANREIGNEWNSPARYPAEIKREKRKPKGRPYWAQFMCCSSVH